MEEAVEGVAAQAGLRSVWHGRASTLLENRVPVDTTIVVVALASVFVLASQSASSVATYLLSVACLSGAGRWRALWFDRGFLLVVALLVYIPLTSFWSQIWDGRDALGQATRSILVLAFVVAVAEGVQVDWFRRWMTLVLATVGAVAALAAAVIFFSESPEDGRLNGLGQLDTHVAAAFVYAVAAVCGLAWLATDGRERGSAKWWIAGCIAVLVVAVILTGSRNAIACLVIAAGCVAVVNRVSTVLHFALWVVSLAAALIATLVLAYCFLPGADMFILPRGDSFRPGIWSDYAGRISAGGLWLGLGVLTRDPIEVAGFPVLHPHGLFLSVTYQGGLLALGLMLAVIGTSVRTLLAHYHEPEAKLGLALFALALPGYLLDGHELVDKIGWTWLLFWLPVGIGLGLRNRSVLDDARRFGVRFQHP